MHVGGTPSQRLRGVSVPSRIVGLIVVLLMIAGSCSSPEADDQADRLGETADDTDVEVEPEAEPTPERTRPLGDPFRPDSIAVDATAVWVSDSACGVVVKIDKATEAVVGAVDVAGSAAGVAAAGGFVWVATRLDASVARIDPDTVEVVGQIPVPGSALGVTADGNEIWATDVFFGSLHRIDATAGRVVATERVGDGPHDAAINGAEVWVANNADDTVSVISPGGGTRLLTVGQDPLHITFGDGSAWITERFDNVVRRVDLATGAEEAVIDVGTNPHSIDFAAGAVWVGTEAGSYWRIDPDSNEATSIEGADFSALDSAADGSTVWVADQTGNVIRIDAEAAEVASVIDLRDFGDCETFRDEGFNPVPDRPRFDL